MNSPLILPDPSCSFGYPLGQVQELLSDEESYGAFLQWARDERVRFGHCLGTRQSVAHGPIVYAADLHRYLEQAAA